MNRATIAGGTVATVLAVLALLVLADTHRALEPEVEVSAARSTSPGH